MEAESRRRFLQTAAMTRTIHFDPVQERILDDDVANSLLTRKYRQRGHWGIPNGV